jgi:hypothetical protein
MHMILWLAMLLCNGAACGATGIRIVRRRCSSDRLLSQLSLAGAHDAPHTIVLSEPSDPTLLRGR